MKKENIKRANELVILIESSIDNIKRWEFATDFNDQGQIRVKGSNNYSYAYILGVPFNILKTLSIEAHTKVKEKLELELENLD